MIHNTHPWAALVIPFCILLIAAVPTAWSANQEQTVLVAKSIPTTKMEMATGHPDILLQVMDSLSEEQFEKVIRFRQNRESFVYASTFPEGSGGFTTEAIFWISPDGGIHRIETELAERACENQVKDGEYMLGGGPGILFSNGALRFEFLIANKGDPHCCPTAGRIRGTYRITGEGHYDPNSKQYVSAFQLVVKKCRREKLPPGD